MKATKAGTALGVALADFDGMNGEAIPGTSTTLYDALTAAVDRSKTTVGDMLVSVRPGLSMPVPTCSLSDILCRSEYFSLLTGTGAASSTQGVFDGYISSAFINDLVVSGRLLVNKLAVTDNVGKGYIPAGSREVTIQTSAVKSTSIFLITFEDDYAPATRFFISRKTPGESFTVGLDADVAHDTHFSWWIVDNQNDKNAPLQFAPSVITQSGGSATGSATPVPSLVPTPTPTLSSTPEVASSSGSLP